MPSFHMNVELQTTYTVLGDLSHINIQPQPLTAWSQLSSANTLTHVPFTTHLLWGNLAEEKLWQCLGAVPYSTHRILGMNHGQQALQQKCPVPLCQLTDSSSPVAVLQLHL